MKSETWKTIAIIFIILFTLETLYVVWSVSLYYNELENTNTCYYDQAYCGSSPSAEYIDNVCYCYEYDILGELVLGETYILK